jgi:D-sedoheptulose 7-phosphate isomerase
MKASFLSLQEALNNCLCDINFVNSVQKSIDLVKTTIEKRATILVIGNGGSASEAQHLVGELVGRFKMERRGYPAISLSSDITSITAIANDYGYEQIFSRQIEALGQKKDLLITLSTSGNSKNCINAIKVAKQNGICTIALLGKNGGEMKGLADIEIIVPSNDTARIQEIHLLIIHTWCEHVEASI